jgi:hypothetical protein
MKKIKKIQKTLKKEIENQEENVNKIISDTQIVDKIQRAYIKTAKTVSGKHNSFKIFSLDASDLDVLEQVEAMVSVKEENPEIEAISDEISKLENLKSELSDVKANEKLFRLKKQLNILVHATAKELTKIEKNGWEEKKDFNSIADLEV